MRLDKFLKVSRLIKRRTLAKQICDAGRVSVNERTAKASTDVQVGDILAVRYGNKTVTVEVRKLAEHPRRDEALELYHVISTVSRQDVEVEYVDDEEA
ncbi:RNA-binding S4 domain-containing protein [Alicyclobacillus fodiniaquatilis]|uniref:RQC P-site tRNA stabilizing factor n=1 Tax=Alicyclobacillus fodiniaquatilis TaxID=1661150 RepID=A0ABW4JDB4_9BACL